jgi:hypothetical protein
MSKSYTKQEVKQRAERILNLPPMTRAGTVNEFFDMACGGNAGGIRHMYYSGKPDNFFRDVLVIINGGK